MQNLAPALGMYVSIPFCRAKCSYCNFASGVYGADRMAAYVEKLTAQIRRAPERVAAWQNAEERRFVSGHDFSRDVSATKSGWPLQVAEKPCFVSGHDFSRAVSAAKKLRALAPAAFSAAFWDGQPPMNVDSLYFGGGTPSLLSINQLYDIVKAIREVFSIDASAEITLECAPGQLSDELLRAMPGLGFNRVSLGVQSFVDQEASAVGRTHTRAITLNDIDRLRAAGIHDINIDLIAGLPHQTQQSWRESLEQAVSAEVPHLSVYMLDVDEDSRLGREIIGGGTRYGVGMVPNEQTIADMYIEAVEQFDAAGIAQYEISNFARAGHRSRHNLKYWTRQPYLGFGLDAHSFLPTADGEAIRVATTDDLAAYLDRNIADCDRETITRVSPAQALEEAWFLGLRLNQGVSLTEITREFGESAIHAYQPILQEAHLQRLMEYDERRARLTQQGRLFANDVFQRFLGVVEDEEAVAIA